MLKKWCIALGFGLVLLTSGCSFGESSNGDWQAEEEDEREEERQQEEDEEEESEREAEEDFEEETEEETEAEIPKQSERGLLIASLTVGDETIYLDKCTVADVVKLFQKVGYEADVDSSPLDREVGAYSTDWENHIEFTRDGFADFRIAYYNPYPETKKVFECSISQYWSDPAHSGDEYPDIGILNNQFSYTEQLYKKNTEIVPVFEPIFQKEGLAEENYSIAAYKVEANEFLESGQKATLEVEFYSDSEADGRYSGEFQGITLTLPVILK